MIARLKTTILFLLFFSSCKYTSQSEVYSSDSVTIFSQTLHNSLVNNCSICHGVHQSPKFALVNDVEKSHEIINNLNLVSLINPSDSYMISHLKRGHNGFSNEVINEILKGIQDWAKLTKDLPKDNEFFDKIEFAPADTWAVLSKIKSAAHGGILLDSDYDSLPQNYTKNDLRALVESWVDSEPGQKIMEEYLTLAWHQDVYAPSAELSGTFRTVGGADAQKSFRESFVRSIKHIIDNDLPLNQATTIKTYAVNTFLLSAYAFMDDRSRRQDSVEFGPFQRSNMVASDYTDWRMVTFEGGGLTPDDKYKDLEHWRSIPNGSTVQFSIPRVGYFSTLAFQGKYPTNVDNDFRVTVNQTVIAGIGQTFLPTDNTPQPLLDGLSDVHSPKGTQCFACHRLMDPMREVFREMGARYRPNTSFQPKASSFAISKYARSMNNLTDLGLSIAQHPDFAKSWVHRMCQIINVSSCVESDPEFQEILNRFKNGLKFKPMYIDLLISNMFTGSRITKTSSIQEFEVRRVRGEKFCRRLDDAVRRIQLRRGLDPEAPENRKSSICNYKSLFDAFKRDSTVRGEVQVDNSASMDALSYQVAHQICDRYQHNITHSDNVFIRQSSNSTVVENNMTYITEYITNLPPKHPRHNIMKEGLSEYYRICLDEFGRSPNGCLKTTIKFACLTPDSLGVGM